MQNNQNQCKKEIMQRVYTIYIMKSVARPLVMELSVVFALIGVTAFFVSVKDIWSNASATPDMHALSNFVYYAFLNTKVVVKILFVGAVGVGLIVCADTVRRVKRIRSLAAYT